MAKTKRAGFLTKLVVLALLIYMSTALLNLQSRIRDAQAAEEALSRQVSAQTQVNADLADAVAHNDDPQRIEAIAREKLNLVAPGDKVFIVTN